jgi:hypothetical protein
MTPFQRQKNAEAKKDSLPFDSPYTINLSRNTKAQELKGKKCLDQRSRRPNLNLESLVLLLLLDLQQESAVDMWENTTKSNGGADERVEFFVSANGELQVTRGDALDFEILGSVLGNKLA